MTTGTNLSICYDLVKQVAKCRCAFLVTFHASFSLSSLRLSCSLSRGFPLFSTVFYFLRSVSFVLIMVERIVEYLVLLQVLINSCRYNLFPTQWRSQWCFFGTVALTSAFSGGQPMNQRYSVVRWQHDHEAVTWQEFWQLHGDLFEVRRV
jgi:hypothetical protein